MPKTPSPPAPSSARLIAVDAPELAVLGARLPERMGVQAVLAAARAESPPRAIVVALFAASPDALDVLEGLRTTGYAGRVIALAPPLPNRRLVQRELSAQAPGLRLRVASLAALRGPGPIMPPPH